MCACKGCGVSALALHSKCTALFLGRRQGPASLKLTCLGGKVASRASTTEAQSRLQFSEDAVSKVVMQVSSRSLLRPAWWATSPAYASSTDSLKKGSQTRRALLHSYGCSRQHLEASDRRATGLEGFVQQYLQEFIPAFRPIGILPTITECQLDFGHCC